MHSRVGEHVTKHANRALNKLQMSVYKVGVGKGSAPLGLKSVQLGGKVWDILQVCEYLELLYCLPSASLPPPRQ